MQDVSLTNIIANTIRTSIYAISAFSAFPSDLPFVREWRLCAELDLWLVSSGAAPAAKREIDPREINYSTRWRSLNTRESGITVIE